eukprot:TRINITY_DN4436_c0_g1_i1.p1 TRINITY_DN4436_c0_g1~~TRINITY_DN4436_c0_g1_i1.p1  ORF type:complete len:679 (-),score=71.76 TRINITY_DN4436_c0_g1_i1:1698-3734(-)
MATFVDSNSDNNNSVVIKEQQSDEGGIERGDSFQFPTNFGIQTDNDNYHFNDQTILNNDNDEQVLNDNKVEVEDAVNYDQIDHRVNEVVSDNVLLAKVIERLQQQDPRELKTKLTASQQSINGHLPKTSQTVNFGSIYDIPLPQNNNHRGQNQLYDILTNSSKIITFEVEGKKFHVPENILLKVQDSTLWDLAYEEKFENLRNEQGCVTVPLVRSDQFSLILDFLAHSSCTLPIQDSQVVIELLGVGEMLRLDDFCNFIRSHREGLMQIRIARDYIYYHPIIQAIIDNFKKLFFAPNIFPSKWAFQIIEDDQKKPHWYMHVILSYYDGFRINPVWFTKEWEKFNKRQAADYHSEVGSAMSKKSQASILKSERLKRRPQSEYSVYFNEKDWPQETTFGFLLTSEQLDMAKIYNYHTGFISPEPNDEFLTQQDVEISKAKAQEHWLFNFFIRYVREVQVQDLYRNIRIPLPEDLDSNNINNALSRALRWRLKEELGAQLFIYHIPYQDPEDTIRTTPYFVQSVGEGKPVVHEFSVKLEFMVPTDELQKYKPISNIGLRQSMQNLVKLEQEERAFSGHSVSSQTASKPQVTLKKQSRTMSDLVATTSHRESYYGGIERKEGEASSKIISFSSAGDIQATSFIEALKQRRELLKARTPMLDSMEPPMLVQNSELSFSSSLRK